MQPIQHFELMDADQYRRLWPSHRERIIWLKRRRRLALGPHMSVLFENRQTVLHQLHEVVRIEAIVDEAKIERELDTCNALLPPPGSLLFTLFLEFTSQAVARDTMEGIDGFDGQVFLRVGASRVAARTVRAQQEPAVAAVNYLHVPLTAVQQQRLTHLRHPVCVEFCHRRYAHAAPLSLPLRRALASELATDLAQASMKPYPDRFPAYVPNSRPIVL